MPALIQPSILLFIISSRLALASFQHAPQELELELELERKRERKREREKRRRRLN